MGEVRLVGVRETALSADEALAAVSDPRAGGVAIFVGTVRCDDGGREVRTLEYEAHPDAAAVMGQIAADVAARPEVIAVAAVHRAGLLKIGDLAVVAAVSCGHRHEAFAAGQQLIDDIKLRAPIWKRQVFVGGDVEWVGIADAAL